MTNKYKVIALILMTFTSNAHAWKQFGNWEEIFWKKGITIQFDFYSTLCSESQRTALIEQYQYVIEDLNAQDPDRTYEYIGTTDESDWGDWAESKVAGFGIVTLECALQADLFGNNIGDGVPIDNCSGQDPDDYTLCSDGSKRYLIDAGMRVAIETPDHFLKSVLTQEFGHAALTFDHSNVPGSSMVHGAFNTEYSAQFLEIWSHDDRCAMHSKIPNMTEWPVKTSVLDDRNWMHIPYVKFIGTWEMVWVKDAITGKYGPEGAKPVPTCESLAQ